MTKYTPSEIPSKVNITLYTHYRINGYNAGELVNYDFDATGEDYIVVAKTPVAIKISKADDIREEVIKALQEEKEKREAEHWKKMQEIDQKIKSLLRLEHKPDNGKVVDLKA